MQDHADQIYNITNIDREENVEQVPQALNAIPDTVNKYCNSITDTRTNIANVDVR